MNEQALLPQPQSGGSFVRERDGSITPVHQTKPGIVRKPHSDMTAQPAEQPAPADVNTSEE
jgi:hypothetical protein